MSQQGSWGQGLVMQFLTSNLVPGALLGNFSETPVDSFNEMLSGNFLFEDLT
jgi:hypothetical protein